MIERSIRNIRILNDDKLTPDEVLAWAGSLYVGERKPAGFEIPDEVLAWGLNEQQENYKNAQNELQRKLILNKILHSREVVEAGKDIVNGETQYKWNRTQAAVICFSHDMGRFKQAQLESFSDDHSHFDHAKYGSELFKNHKWKTLEKYGVNVDEVVSAIDTHSRLSYDGTNIYSKLIRDADKLALLRYSQYWFAELTMSGVPITQEALSEYLEGRLIEHKNVNTKIDTVLNALSWKYDLNFKTTKNIFKSEKIEEWLLGIINILSKDVYSKIKYNSVESIA